MSTPSVAQGRVCILLAAVLWSLGGAFTKVLTEPTALGLNDPAIETWLLAGKNVPLQIACYRASSPGWCWYRRCGGATSSSSR